MRDSRALIRESLDEREVMATGLDGVPIERPMTVRLLLEEIADRVAHASKLRDIVQRLDTLRRNVQQITGDKNETIITTLIEIADDIETLI